MIHIGQRLKQLAFLACQRPVAIQGFPVGAFACIARNGQDSHVRLFGFPLNHGAIHFEFRDNGRTQQNPAPAVDAAFGFHIRQVGFIPRLDIFVHFHAIGLEAFGNVADIGLVDIAGTRIVVAFQ